ncbi:MAG: carbon monoxide dehydrogenase [Acidimicrobiales bacterium mtb01]|nr:carbon monoxide dehydrogenase [Actinomycetota bacterium]TEX45826.1 MAG: carbon monoxide dehydrogenase [Acidimicrobiales bacterium mtb01]
MDLNHSFTVNRSIAETWIVLTNLERLAPCLPGAELQEVHGDVYKGVVKIKVGPITAQFKGEAQFAEMDASGYKAVLKASGRDTGGKGNASATITATLTEISPTATTCNVVTDLSITGKVAQFGRGALADVSDKLLGQFSDNLNALIEREGTGAPAPAAPAAATPSTDASGQPTVRKIEGPAAEPLNLGDVAGGAVMKRFLPIAAGVAAALLFLRGLFRRRRRKS